MNPFFFGTSAEPLFGVYQPPRSPTPRRVSVLLCCPLGQEYMRSHRAFRQLTGLLARAGFPVMRFDYFGTGDSAGDSGRVSVARCVADVETAVEELRAMSGVSGVALVGLRLGATIAALATQGLTDLSRVVLWDPVIDGPAHVEELLGESLGGADPDGTIGVLGFPLTSRLADEIRSVDVLGALVTSGAPCMVVVSDREAEQRRYFARLCLEERASVLSIPSHGNWNEVDSYGSALIPQAVIRGIVNHLSQSVAA